MVPSDRDVANRILSSCDWEKSSSSWYGDPKRVIDHYQGLTAADGSTFNTWENTVAHRDLPFGTEVLIRSGLTTVVKATVTDRGPYIGDREFDVSYNLAHNAKVKYDPSVTLLDVGVGEIETCVLPKKDKY